VNIKYVQPVPKIQFRQVVHSLAAVALGSVLTSCTFENISPTSTEVTVVNQITTTSESKFRDPTVPNVGGKGLPTSDSPIDEEIDCEDAENLCEEGIYPCDDIADYCDYGPDIGELPDEFDWDK
jgi:hypothetical protein